MSNALLPFNIKWFQSSPSITAKHPSDWKHSPSLRAHSWTMALFIGDHHHDDWWLLTCFLTLPNILDDDDNDDVDDAGDDVDDHQLAVWLLLTTWWSPGSCLTTTRQEGSKLLRNLRWPSDHCIGQWPTTKAFANLTRAINFLDIYSNLQHCDGIICIIIFFPGGFTSEGPRDLRRRGQQHISWWDDEFASTPPSASSSSSPPSSSSFRLKDLLSLFSVCQIFV